MANEDSMQAMLGCIFSVASVESPWGWLRVLTSYQVPGQEVLHGITARWAGLLLVWAAPLDRSTNSFLGMASQVGLGVGPLAIKPAIVPRQGRSVKAICLF